MLYNSDQTVSSGSYHEAIHGIYLRAIFSTTSQPSRYLYNLLPLTDLKCGVINFNKKKNNDQWPYLQEQQKCLIQNGRQGIMRIISESESGIIGQVSLHKQGI